MKCTKKLQVSLPHLCDFSASGWVREEIMINYLWNVVYPYTDGKWCALLLDSYRAHITETIYQLCETLNVELIVVPVV